jgi:hypothetical protein
MVAEPCATARFSVRYRTEALPGPGLFFPGKAGTMGILAILGIVLIVIAIL